MRVLLISQYFPPEVTAASARLESLAAGLTRRGHEVEVICEVPNHPTGVVADDYSAGGERRRVDGYDVQYVRVRTRPEKTTLNRLLFYGTFAASALVAGVRTKRPDVVVCSSPPLPAGAAAALVARRHRVPWVFDVRDLWPEAAVVLGELRGERAIRAAERLERGLYRSASRIVTVTEPFRQQIASRTDDAAKIEVIPNGTSAAWIEAGEHEPDRDAAGIPADRYVWAYGGNIGLAQGLDTAVEAAAKLGDEFRLLVIGAGPKLEEIRQQAQRRAVDVDFRPLAPAPEAAAILRACDALLVPLAPQPELARFVPSKLFDFCALARPVLVAAAGEPQRLAAEADAGLPVEPGDADALAAAVRKLRDDPGLSAHLSQHGRRFAEENVRDRGVERFERVLRDAISESA